MEQNKKPEDFYGDIKSGLKSNVKDHIFDIIAVGIVVGMLLLSLGAIEFKAVTWRSLLDTLIECLPFFLAAMLLNTNFYTKGTFMGKREKKYTDTVSSYSVQANAITGEELDSLEIFCSEYNENALKQIQTNILKRAAISYERFDKEEQDKDKGLVLPLKTLSKRELIALLGEERAKIVVEAKKAHVKGIDVNTLLSCNKSSDITVLGQNENELARKRKGKSAASWLISVFLMALMGVNDVASWGWLGIGIIVFKLFYIVGRSYMAYFEGYNDITTYVISYYARKSDVLKQFKSWYDKRATQKAPTNNFIGEKPISKEILPAVAYENIFAKVGTK